MSDSHLNASQDAHPSSIFLGWEIPDHSGKIHLHVIFLSVEQHYPQGKTVGLFTGLIILHGILNSLATRHLARLTKGFVFVNLGTTFGEREDPAYPA